MNSSAHSVIRVLLADDHALMRAGVAAVVDRQPEMTVVAEAADGSTALALYAQHVPDVAVVDLRMPGMEGVELIEAIRERFPTARIIILSTFDTDDDIQRGLNAGARGYLLKSATGEQLAEAIRDVCAGETVVCPTVASKLAKRMTEHRFTARELSVLKLVVHGRANKEIAQELLISEGTVKLHLTHLFDKLGVASRTEAVASALRRGLVRLN